MRRVMIVVVVSLSGFLALAPATASTAKNKVLCITNERPPLPPTPEICLPYPLG